MALTEEAICNMALGHLGGLRITDLDVDDSTEAELCNDNYEYCRDFVLESRDWTFARKRDEITIDGSAPDFEWKSRFARPADCITLRRLSNDPTDMEKAEPYELEGSWILTDTNVLYVIYTEQIIDVTLFSPAFTRALVYFLASVMASALTDNAKIEDILYRKFERTLEQAGGRDGVQTRPRRVRTTQFKRYR